MPDLKDQILDSWNAGSTLGQVATEVGTTEGYVKTALVRARKRGCEVRRVGTKPRNHGRRKAVV